MQTTQAQGFLIAKGQTSFSILSHN